MRLAGGGEQLRACEDDDEKERERDRERDEMEPEETEWDGEREEEPEEERDAERPRRGFTIVPGGGSGGGRASVTTRVFEKPKIRTFKNFPAICGACRC